MTAFVIGVLVLKIAALAVGVLWLISWVKGDEQSEQG